MSDLFDSKEDLFNELQFNRKFLEKRKDPSINIPSYITDNINKKLFEWQERALKNFLIYESDYKKNPTHLMFNMATGSGKTLVMASLILYYYKQGYRHFLFFVNQNNIVDKTENNFLDYTHKKYLFNQNIVIDNKKVDIKKVNLFSDNTDTIEIKFTTIQKLHNDIRAEKENTNTLEEFNSLNIVMLADEGHHLNSLTKSKKEEQNILKLSSDLKDGAKQEDIEKAWEYTVIERLLKKVDYTQNNTINKNVLLEFTATIAEHKEIANKYKDKIVYKYPLLDFMQEGYTKEINLISSQLDKKQRILFALLFNWYRHKLSIIFNIANFKPVILFRSKTIEESKNDYEYFIKLVSSLTEKDFNFFNNIQTIINKIIDKNYNEDAATKTEILSNFINKNKISTREIINYIKYNFKEENIIITNSDNKLKREEKTDDKIEALLNNLEDKNNPIRAIFTVKRLTEGWDVLNLFDIVRLNEGQSSGGSNGKTGSSTVQEAQLIGRGVRYNPFTVNSNFDTNYIFNNENIKIYPYKYKDYNPYKRKFDSDLTHDLRMLEELNYYTYDERSRYISELKNELKKRGLLIENREKKQFFIKDSIKQTDFYKNIKVFTNEQIENPNRKKLNLNEIKELEEIKNYEYFTRNIDILEDELEKDTHKTLELSEKKDILHILIRIKEYPRNIFYKCIHSKASKDNSIFSFERLKNELSINSISDLLRDDFLGNIKIKILTKETQNFENISIDDKINALSILLDKIGFYIENEIIEKVGTEFDENGVKNIDDIFGGIKEKLINKKENPNSQIKTDIINKDWFMLNDYTSTEEENNLIDFIEKNITNLKNKYDNVFLLRNEEVYKIYSFKNGKGFEPDYLLFLSNKSNSTYYQVFIEPKGENLFEKDKSKNDFLEEISIKYKNKLFKVEDNSYTMFALPFYNSNSPLPSDWTFKDFNNEFNKLI